MDFEVKEELRQLKRDRPFYSTHANFKRKSKDCLSYDEFAEWHLKQLDEPFCHYCDTILDFDDKRGLTGFTVDRKNPAKGYTLDNIVPSCRKCNMIKGNWFTEKQMLEIAHRYLKR